RPAGEAGEGGLLALGVERRPHVLALALLVEELVDHGLELVALAGQLGVARALEAGAPALDERVADGVREQVPARIGAHEALRRPMAELAAAREDRPVVGEDQATRDLLLLEQ